MTAADGAPDRAHLDGPCSDACHGPTDADTSGEASAFLRAVTGAGTPATVGDAVKLPPAVEEHEELWAALRTLQERVDTAENGLAYEAGLRSQMHLAASAMSWSLPLVQALADREALDGDAIRAELAKTVGAVLALINPYPPEG